MSAAREAAWGLTPLHDGKLSTSASGTSLDSTVESLGHLVLSVCCVPSHCLLTPLMSPDDKKCKLVDWCTQHWLHATKQDLTLHLLTTVHLPIEKGM